MTPAKNPRTECSCQPVAFIIAVIVVPFGCFSRAITVAFFEFKGTDAAGALLAGRFAVWRAFVFFVVLTFGMGDPSFVSDGTSAVTTEAPQLA
jgi:hypothetical protein